MRAQVELGNAAASLDTAAACLVGATPDGWTGETADVAAIRLDLAERQVLALGGQMEELLALAAHAQVASELAAASCSAAGAC